MASVIQQSDSVTAHNVIIDKLAITFDVPASQVTLIAERVRSLAMEPFARPCGSQNYDVGVKLFMNEHLIQEKATSSCVTVHTKPKIAGYKLCRVEWNPAKIATDDIAYIVFEDMLELDFSFLGSGTVTRIDLAIDIDNVQIDDIVFHVPKFQLFENRYKSGLTRYIGGRASGRYFCCYDKRAEIIEHNMKVNPLHRVDVPEHPLMRIETRLRPKISWPNVANIENPFLPMQLRHFLPPSEESDSTDGYFRLLLGYALCAGLGAALAKLGKREKARMLKRVLATQEACEWWRPNELWDGFLIQYGEINSFVSAVDCKQAVGWAS